MVIFRGKFGMFFSCEVLLWYACQFPPELLENATNFLLCRGVLEALKRTHLDFSRLLPIPQYVSNVTQAMIQSALATADKTRWILCEDCSVWAIWVRGKKEGRGKQASSLPPPIKYHCWSPLRPELKSAMNWAFCGMGLDLQWGDVHRLLEYQNATGTVCDGLKH